MKIQNIFIFIFILITCQLFAGERNEIISERTLKSKTYLNEDGSKTLSLSGGYYHFRNEAGELVEIDRAIKNSPDPDYDYEVTEGLYNVFFRSDLKNDYSVKIERRDGFQLQSNPFGVAYLDISTKEYHILQMAQSSSPVLNNNEIIYPGVFKNVDVKYTYNDTRLKEEIIVSQTARNRLPNPSIYGFDIDNTYLVFVTELAFDSLQIERHLSQVDSTSDFIEGDMRIDFRTIRNELKFFFPVDYAFYKDEDELNIQTKKVRKRLIQKNGKHYLLAGIPLQWIRDLPEGEVVIDPTVSISDIPNDTYIQGSSTTNYSSYSYFYVGAVGSPYRRGLIQFDFSNVPSDIVISNAKLKIYYYGYTGYYMQFSINVGCYQLLKDWDEDLVNWNYARISDPEVPWNVPGAGLDDIDAKSTYEDVQTVYSTYGWINYNLTALTKKWLNNDAENFGVLLRDQNEGSLRDIKKFYSSEYSDPSKRPNLEITYNENNTYYYLKDHLGNIRVTIDEEGEVKGYDDYYPFGLRKAKRSFNDGNTSDPYKYSSKELDEENGLDWYYFGARYYDAEIGRFLSVDRFADKYPSMTPYQYAANNPILFVDVNGDSVWINYTDKNGSYRFLYTQGMSAKSLDGSAAYIVNILNSVNIDKKGNNLLSTLTGSSNNYEVKLGMTISNSDATYEPNENGGGTLTMNPNRTGQGSSTGKFMALIFNTAHELQHAEQHDRIGSEYYHMGIRTDHEGEAFDTQFGMYNRFRRRFGIESFGMTPYKNKGIYKNWREWANAPMVKPYYKNYMKSIYDTYQKNWDIKYIGP